MDNPKTKVLLDLASKIFLSNTEELHINNQMESMFFSMTDSNWDNNITICNIDDKSAQNTSRL
jgi:hypothetical protein